MIKIVYTELLKLKRYNIVWFGVASILFSIILATFQLVGTKNSVVTYSGLCEGVIWNHFSLFLPFTFTLLVGYCINREYADSTLKNILTVPILFSKLTISKIVMGFLLVIAECFFSFAVTLVISVLLRCSDITIPLCWENLRSLFIVSSCCYIAVLPIIVFFTRKPDKFLSGVIFAFVYGFFGIFVAERNLVNFYPMTTGLVLSNYVHNDQVVYQPIYSLLILIFLFILTGVALINSKKSAEFI